MRPRHRALAAAAFVVAAVALGIPMPPAAAQVTELSADDRAGEALAAARKGRFVRARELATEALRDRPDSVEASIALGLALHEGEGNIPLALRQFQHARRLIEGDRGLPPSDSSELHREVLYDEMRALSDLGRYEELLALSAKLRRLYDPQLHSVDVWPLMKLGRIEEARAASERALASGDRFEEVVARNGLCALDGYTECLEMLRAVERHRLNPGLALRNAGVSAAVAGRLDEAERMLLESTRYPDEDTNPWRDLVDLYALEARLAEALDAARRMAEFGQSLPPRERQYSRAEELVAGGKVLLLAGRPERALAATDRAIQAPDRAAHWSGSAPELQAEGSLLHRAVLRTLAQRARERAATAPWRSRPAALARAAWHSTRGWLAGRRVLPLLLAGGLRGEEGSPSGDTPSLSGPLWLTLDAIEVFGPGPALSLVRDARREGSTGGSSVPEALRLAQLDAMECEALCLLGDREGCLESGQRALAALPAQEVLLRARIVARMAAAAWRDGDAASAFPWFDEVLRVDPGALRRLGLRLPVAMDASLAAGPRRAARLVLASPRFVEDPASPFVLTALRGELCLATRGAEPLACGDTRSADGSGRPAAESTAPPSPTMLAESLLRAAFAPRIDLSQQDLGSLDGSTGVDRKLDLEPIEKLLQERGR